MSLPRVALLTISDRPDLLEATLESFRKAGGFECVPIVVCVTDNDHRLGFAGAIREGWRRLREQADPFDYVFHLEDDWQFEAPVDLEAMAFLLESYPGLAQVALRRGPVNATELAAGGVVEMWPDEYTDKWLLDRAAMPGTSHAAAHLPWLDHGLYFTTNPSLYRRGLMELGWPEGPASEQEFTAKCLRAGLRFALYGARADAPRVTHTGTDRREGKGY